MLPFGLHPGLLILLLVMVVVLMAAAFAVGWAFRKGWESAGPRTERDPAPE